MPRAGFWGVPWAVGGWEGQDARVPWGFGWGELPPQHISAPGSFSNLGIQCVKKKEIEAAIEKKLQLGIDPFKGGGGSSGAVFRG